MSTAPPAALPTLLTGRPVVDEMKASLVKQVEACREQGMIPRLATVLTSGDPSSVLYAHQKARIGQRLGIDVRIVEAEANVEQNKLVRLVSQLSQRPDIHGVMLELPLPKHIELAPILDVLAPAKDVDGLTNANRMANMTGAPGIYPATPLACLALMDHYGIDVAGREIVLIGCGHTVGNPLFHGLIRRGATVTVCTEQTLDLKSHLQRVSLAIVAVGRAGLIQPAMVHKDLVLVDVGMSQLADGRIVGDVHPDVVQWVTAMTPSPGGVGAVTTMQLFSNLLQAVSLQTMQNGLRTEPLVRRG